MYRLKKKTIALEVQEGSNKMIALPIGTIFHPNDALFQNANDHVDVDCICDGRTVRLFASDIRDRAEPIGGSTFAR